MFTVYFGLFIWCLNINFRNLNNDLDNDLLKIRRCNRDNLGIINHISS